MGEGLISLRLERGEERGLDEEEKLREFQGQENKKCFAMISSHFSALKEYAFLSENNDNSSMIFDEEHLSPTYIFRQGAPGMSYALDVANRYGISQEIVQIDKEFIKNSNIDEGGQLISILQKKSSH